MEIKNIISLVSVFGFIIFILLGTDVRRNYLLFVAFVFPFMDLFITPVSQGGYRVFDAVSYIALIFLIKKPGTYKYPKTLYFPALVIMMFLLLWGTLRSEFVGVSLISLSQISSVFIFATLLIRECYEDPDFKYLIIKGIKISCVLSLIFLVFQLIFGLSVTLYQLNPNTSSYDTLIRYPSFFQDPQKYGQYLAICSFLFLIEDPKNPQKYYQNLLLFFAVIVAIFFTGVRAAFTGLVAGMVIVFLFGDKKFKLLGLACVLVVCVVAIFFSSHFALFNRESDVNDTAAVRYAYWAGAYKIFLKFPYLGIGIGNYQSYVSLHSQDQYWLYFGTYEYMDHPESGYFKILVEFGIFAFIIHQALIFVPIYKSAKSLVYRYADSKILLFLIAGVVSWMAAFFTVFSFSDLRVFILVVTLLCIMVSFSPDSEKKSIYEN